MQWLIDLVIEKIGIPPVYIHRGDPLDFDIELPALTTNAIWNELDLSAIVPAGAKAVHLFVGVTNTFVSSRIQFRRPGQVGNFNVCYAHTHLAAVPDWYDLVQALDSDRKIEYFAGPLGWTHISIIVRGWWL